MRQNNEVFTCSRWIQADWAGWNLMAEDSLLGKDNTFQWCKYYQNCFLS